MTETPLSVCVDCLTLLANGEVWDDNGDNVAAAHNAKVEAIWGPSYEIALAGDDDGDEGSFSWSQCDGCHSTLGGDRYSAVAFTADDDDAARKLEADLRDAEKKGVEYGRAAGSWVIDGNTSEETARAILQGIEDGDPAIYDGLPSAPLSGEWADGLLPRDVLAWYGRTEDDDAAADILDAFEVGFDRGVEYEVVKSASIAAGVV